MTSKLMGLHQHELIETAKLFSSKGNKVNVVFDDGGARTDGKTIYLPNTAPDVALSERGQRFDRAMVDHEASHHDVTNMKHFTAGVSGGDKRLEGLVQSIEDCRVDKNAMLKHPGSRKNLGTARDISFEGSAELIEGADDARHFAGTGIINAWWEKYGGWPSENRKRAFEALPPEMQDFCRKYADLADELTLKRTTKPTVELAKKALAELEAMGPMPMDDDEPEGSGGEQEQQQEQENEQDTEQQSSMAEGDEGGQDQGGSDGDEAGQDGSTSFDAGSEIDSTDLAQAHERMMENEAEGYEKGGYVPYRNPNNVTLSTRRLATLPDWQVHSDYLMNKIVERYKGWGFRPENYQDEWSNTLRAVRGSVAKTQAKLTEAFMASSQRLWSGGYDSGALDPRAFVRAYQGRDGAFRRKDTGDDINAAVTLLLDCSGSMYEHGKEKVAGAMVVALAMVLERMNVAVEVRGFTSDSRGRVADMIFKPFDMPVAQSRCGLSVLMQASNMENHDYVNVRTAADSLLKRNEAKRMLIVLSDGQPVAFGRELESFCRALHDRGELSLLGVGIKSNSVERYYPNNVVVWKLEELSTVVAERIARTLLGRGLKVTREAA